MHLFSILFYCTAHKLYNLNSAKATNMLYVCIMNLLLV